ncbi:MAG: hypothetical protein JWO76_618 [Nocardioides sp.]|nr:hypothetical protein [Nocardioides sp.]
MAKRLTHALTYDAPLAAVAAMLADPAFREEVCEAQHVLRHTVTVEGDAADGGLDVTIDQVRAATGVPSFAKKFVGDEIDIVQTEHWSSPESGDIRMTIPGKPGEMSGTAELTESGGTTTETVALDVKVGIPLVGGKIEGLITDLLLKAYRVENEVGRDYLSR